MSALVLHPEVAAARELGVAAGALLSLTIY